MKQLSEYLKLNESYGFDDYRNSNFESVEDVLDMFRKIQDEEKFKTGSLKHIDWKNVNESDFKEISKDDLYDIFYSKKKHDDIVNVVLYKHIKGNKFVGFSLNKSIAPLTLNKEGEYYSGDWFGTSPNSFQSTGSWSTKDKYDTITKYGHFAYYYAKVKI